MRILIFIEIVLSFSSCLSAGDAGIQTSSPETENAIIAPVCSAGSFATFNTEHFRIIHQAQTCDIEKIAGLLNLAYERFHSVFSDIGFAVDSPKEKLTWICFDDSGRFNDYALQADKIDLSWLSSYYSTKTNVVAIVKPDKIPDVSKRSLSRVPESSGDILAISVTPESQNEADTVRLVHEAAHQLAFNTGLQKRNVMYPLWVSEGLATMFETALSGSCDTVRGGRLVEMRRHNRLCKLSEFITITRLPSDADAQKDFYAQAWGLFRFLSEHHKDGLVKYFAGLYQLKPGPRNKTSLYSEFVGSFGSVKQMDKSWLDFIGGLSAAGQ
jgi:Protein of unknown function (DUF1570)